LGIGPPDGAADGAENGPDDEPGHQQYRDGDEQEAGWPPAVTRGFDERARRSFRQFGHESRSTLGATLRYQPSLMAASQAPLGKVGMDWGTISAKRSRSSGAI